MAFANGNEILASLVVPIAQETGESTIKTMSQKATTVALGKKQDILKNTTSFDAVPVVNRNSSKVSYATISDGYGGGCVVRRDSKGHINLLPKNSIPNEGDVAISVDKVNDLLANIFQSTIFGTDVAKGASLTSAIKLSDYGMFVVKGEDVTVTYSAQGEGSTAQQSVTSDFHFFIKYKQNNESGTNKIIHIYQTSVLNGYVKSFDGELVTDLNVANGSTKYGARVIKMQMKAVM